MSFSVSIENLARLESYYRQRTGALNWPHVFVLPGWLDAWWQVFGPGFEPLICVVREAGSIIGIAPLKLRGGKASFIGDASVCDYLDFIVAPGKEINFAEALFETMTSHHIKFLDMETLRPESSASHNAIQVAHGRQYFISCSAADVSFELELPAGWPDYLNGLEAKQRHEVERKLRRLDRMGEVNFRVLQDAEVSERDMALFLEMLAQSRREKAHFLTPEMRVFFENIARAMADYGLLRLGFLELNTTRVAAIFYFDYNNRIYLYNSGYLSDYGELSVGLMAKVWCIRHSIAQKKRIFDFLKGDEIYKSRLGGREISLSSCHIALT